MLLVVRLPPVRERNFTTPVKAKTSGPPHHSSTSCPALTWRGLGEATRTGSRGRGRGLRQTLGRHTAGTAHVRQRERFGDRLGDSVGQGPWPPPCYSSCFVFPMR